VLGAGAAKAKARAWDTAGAGPSFDPRLHAPQHPSLATLANAQQQCSGAAEIRSYTARQQKLLPS
jgi:hypothetical protein